MPASRTTKTLRPAELTQILPTGLLVGETRLELGQIPRIIFHFPRSYILWSPESSEYPSGVKGPKGGKTIMVFARAYDSGTEMNDELCANIPAGGSCGGTGFDPDRTAAEGYVHVHRGIHGVGPDLSPETYDWRNPVARIVITRSGGGDDDDE